MQTVIGGNPESFLKVDPRWRLESPERSSGEGNILVGPHFPEYWIVDQMDDSVSVYRLTQGKYPDPLILRKDEILEFPLLPGFSIRLSDVFPS